uniref:Uncharacterized protein n=1 Tax=Cacopsylla melanoneura TaxID=428564 RepID=A0A8D8Z1M6_9HEMI
MGRLVTGNGSCWPSLPSYPTTLICITGKTKHCQCRGSCQTPRRVTGSGHHLPWMILTVFLSQKEQPCIEPGSLSSQASTRREMIGRLVTYPWPVGNCVRDGTKSSAHSTVSSIHEIRKENVSVPRMRLSGRERWRRRESIRFQTGRILLY